MNLEGQHGEDPTFGDTKFTEAGDITTLGTRSAEMGNGEHATTLDLSEVWNGLQGSDSDDRTATSLVQFLK